MALKISVEGKSLRITDSNTGTSIALRNNKTDGYEMHISAGNNGKASDNKAAQFVQASISRIVKGMDSKLGYEARFKKVLKMIAGAKTFRTLQNQLTKLEAVPAE